MELTINDFMLPEEKCVEILKELRWKDGKVTCVYCNSENVVKNGSVCKYYHKYWCKDCNRHFRETTGTIFSHSNMQLREWFYIARELQRGISINQIAKELGRSYRHVMNAAHKIMDSVFMQRLVGLSGDDVEVDELYQSAGQKGTKCEDREPRKRGLKLRGRGTYDKDKPPIVAAVERGGRAVIEVFRNFCKENIDAFLYFVEGRFTHTDDYRIYDHLDDMPGSTHVTVNHSKREYSRCYIHSNTVEGLFCDLRNWLRKYKGVCKNNLHKFVSLFQFNYNRRDLSPMDKFLSLVNVSISCIS